MQRRKAVKWLKFQKDRYRRFRIMVVVGHKGDRVVGIVRSGGIMPSIAVLKMQYVIGVERRATLKQSVRQDRTKS